MDAAWAEQQALRKIKRARTKEEEQAFGWKTKRDIYIEAYECAVSAASDGLLEAYNERLDKAEVRAAKIYLDAYFAAKDEDKEAYQADLAAKNELKRAHLEKVDAARMNTRDQEVWAMEDAIRAAIRKNMTPDELEQLELAEEHERALVSSRVKTKAKAKAGKAHG